MKIICQTLQCFKYKYKKMNRFYHNYEMNSETPDHRYAIIEKLSEGGFAQVYKACDSKNKKYALKRMDSKHILNYQYEIHILQHIKHTFICTLVDSYQDSHLNIVLELIKGQELFHVLKTQHHNFNERVIRFIGGCILCALQHLHKKNILYRDLKPENIMLGLDGYIKLIDFGFAKHIEDKTYTMCGTIDYLSPEVLKTRCYTLAVDMWAFGVVLYELHYGISPFWNQNVEVMKWNIQYVNIQSLIRQRHSFSLIFSHCLEGLLIRDPKMRKTANALVWDRFFKTLDFDLLEKRKVKPMLFPLIDHSE